MTATPVVLEWNAPAECPSRASVEAEVARLASASESSQRLHARAWVVKVEDAVWTLHLATEIERRNDERDFTAASCADLAATAAVVLAVAIDPTHDAAPVPPAVAAPPPPAPPPPALPPPPSPPPPRVIAVSRAPAPETGARASAGASPAASFRFAFHGGLRASAGVLATPAFGAELGLAWTPRHGRVEVAGLFFPSSDVAGPSGSGAGGSFTLLAGRLSGCWMPLDAQLQLGACLGVTAGSLGATATGTNIRAESTDSAWGGASLGGLLLVPMLVSHLSLRLALDVAVPFKRDSFDVSGVSGDIHTPSPVAAEGFLGLEAHFP